MCRRVRYRRITRRRKQFRPWPAIHLAGGRTVGQGADRPGRRGRTRRIGRHAAGWRPGTATGPRCRRRCRPHGGPHLRDERDRRAAASTTAFRSTGWDCASADGRIALGGATLAKGYRNPVDPDPFAEPGWFRTDDLGAVDDSGVLSVLGRADDAISTGGLTVLPGPVEAALGTHPAVSDCAVFGVTDDRLGQRVVAAVVVRIGSAAPTLDELRDMSRAHWTSPPRRASCTSSRSYRAAASARSTGRPWCAGSPGPFNRLVLREDRAPGSIRVAAAVLPW